MNPNDAEGDVRRYLAGKLAKGEVEPFIARVVSDHEQAAAADAAVSAFAGLGATTQLSVSQDELIRYVEDKLDPVDREIVEAAIETDPQLAGLVAEMRSVRVKLSAMDPSDFALPPARSRAPRFLLARRYGPLVLGVGVAGLVAFLVIRGETGHDRSGDASALIAHRGPATVSDASEIDKIVIPADVIAMALATSGRKEMSGAGGRLLRPLATWVDSVRPELEWQPIPGAVSYQVRIEDESGTPVYEGQTKATRTSPPNPLPRGKVYSWSVLANARDGSLVEALTAGVSLPGRFGVLSAARSSQFHAKEGTISPTNPVGRVETEVSFGLLDAAETDLVALQGKKNGTDEVRALDALLKRIRSRRN